MQDPEWLPAFDRASTRGPEAHMALAIDIALASAARGGGPFGAVVADAAGHVIDVGWNEVVASHDSTAHAEVVALRRAQRRLATHTLAGCAMYASCAPCIQCYGALYWSGISKVYAAARKADAEAIGFDEGPPMEGLWAHAARAKGIGYVADFGRDERALAPLRAFREAGGARY